MIRTMLCPTFAVAWILTATFAGPVQPTGEGASTTPVSGGQSRAPQPLDTGKPPLKAAAVPTTPAWAGRQARFGGTEWITRARQDAPLGFTLAVEVQEIKAKGGMTVKKDDELIRARDGEVLAALAAQKARADNKTEVDSATFQRDLAKARFDGVKEAKAADASSKAEYEEREAQFKVAEVAVESAEKRLIEEAHRADQLREQAKRYRILAPFDGIVDQVVCEIGQTVTENQPVMRLVDIEALYVDVPIRTDQTLGLKLRAGHLAWVLLDVPGEPVMLVGKILYVAPTADAASNTRRVRVEVANADLLPPGTAASVRFSAPEGNWNESERPLTIAQPGRGARGLTK